MVVFSGSFPMMAGGAWDHLTKRKGLDAMNVAMETERVRLIRLPMPQDDRNEGEDLLAGLCGSPRTVPCRYLYDEKGSALFEKICETPEYYPTRTERRILAGHAAQIAETTGPCEIVELGSGAATKTRLLLAAFEAASAKETSFVPIDISEEILCESAIAIAEAHPRVRIIAYSGTYDMALQALHPCPSEGRLFLFLGSTIGNFTDSERRAFLGSLRQAMAPGDFLLLGIDRQKAPAVIEAAYNDAEGLTAAFNLNLLDHLNARFGATFDTRLFRHRAHYDTRRHQIEMHLESLQRQTIRFRSLDAEFDLAEGETIRTEISRKFDPDAFSETLKPLGYRPLRQWSDSREWFSLLLFASGPVGQEPAP